MPPMRNPRSVDRSQDSMPRPEPPPLYYKDIAEATARPAQGSGQYSAQPRQQSRLPCTTVFEERFKVELQVRLINIYLIYLCPLFFAFALMAKLFCSLCFVTSRNPQIRTDHLERRYYEKWVSQTNQKMCKFSLVLAGTLRLPSNAC
jgi:hypothetical protein